MDPRLRGDDKRRGDDNGGGGDDRKNGGDDKRGFTLIELVLVIALLGILAPIVAYIAAAPTKVFSLVSSRRVSLTAARIATERLKRELELLAAETDISSFSASGITFDLPSETGITYSLSGADLMRNSDVLASNINTFSLAYLDSSGGTATLNTDILTIVINVKVQAPGAHGLNVIRVRVTPRNFTGYYTNFQ